MPPLTPWRQNTGLPTRFMLVPTSAYVYQDELPANAPSYDQQQLLDRASQLQQAENIPVAQALLDAREEYIYYRTDHHWTTKGAYLAYEAYMKAAGREDEILTQEELEAVKQETPDFYGTLYSQAGARFYKPDTITWYDFPGLTMEQPGKEPTSIYDRSYLDQKDKYSLFFGGNPPPSPSALKTRRPMALFWWSRIPLPTACFPIWQKAMRRSMCLIPGITAPPSANTPPNAAPMRFWCSIRPETLPKM